MGQWIYFWVGFNALIPLEWDILLLEDIHSEILGISWFDTWIISNGI